MFILLRIVAGDIHNAFYTQLEFFLCDWITWCASLEKEDAECQNEQKSCAGVFTEWHQYFEIWFLWQDDNTNYQICKYVSCVASTFGLFLTFSFFFKVVLTVSVNKENTIISTLFAFAKKFMCHCKFRWGITELTLIGNYLL